jgi:hypothetical protein
MSIYQFKALSHPMPYIGELAAHGIGSWTTPVGLIENLTEFCTVSLGGSWIAGIVGVTLGMTLNLQPSHLKCVILMIVFNCRISSVIAACGVQWHAQ